VINSTVWFYTGRGEDVNSPVSKKVEKLAEFKNNFENKCREKEGCSVLFGILPWPSSCMNVNKKNLLNEVIETFFDAYWESRDIIFRSFFGENEAVRYDLLY
jgi:hypothetical protein